MIHPAKDSENDIDITHSLFTNGLLLFSMHGHFDFSETSTKHSEFYQRIEKPLLSMSTVGSIDVDHKIKPIK